MKITTEETLPQAMSSILDKTGAERRAIEAAAAEQVLSCNIDPVEEP